MQKNSPHAIVTMYITNDGLRVYDLDPQAPDLYAVAGPDGVDPTTIDADSLPEGFRWVEPIEWESLFTAAFPLLAEAVKNGAAWGANEADLWHDQHSDFDTPPEFTATWEGRLDHVPESDREEYRKYANLAAKVAWDEYFSAL